MATRRTHPAGAAFLEALLGDGELRVALRAVDDALRDATDRTARAVSKKVRRALRRRHRAWEVDHGVPYPADTASLRTWRGPLGISRAQFDAASAADIFALIEASQAGRRPFIPNDLQQRILDALYRDCATADKLCRVVECDRSGMYPGGLKELKARGLIRNRKGRGYYRPDEPPAVW